MILQNDLKIYDSGHTQHFRGPIQDNKPRTYFGLQLVRLLPEATVSEARDIWEDYWSGIETKVENSAFDLIAIENRAFSKQSYLLMHEYGMYAGHNSRNFEEAKDAKIDYFFDLIEVNYKMCGTAVDYNLAIYRPNGRACECG